jgi:hypothetical protein
MNIALVQLGNSPKAYFWENLEHIKKFHAANEIYVISDLKEVITNAQKRGFKGHLYITPASLNELFSRHTLSKKFRNGFWQLSALRLFALLDFCLSSDEESVLHVESDVLLMPNFPFSTITSQSKLMWFNFNNDRDIASIIWIPSQRQASWMNHKLFKIFAEDPTITDMSALRKLSMMADDQINYFPSSPHTATGKVEDSSIEHVTKHKSKILRDQGIFDGAAIGMWLTGEDPNNHRGVLLRLRHLSDGPIDLRNRQFKMIENNLYLVERDVFHPVYNLHIHSKNRYLFSRNGTFLLRFYVLLSNKKMNFPIFMPITFLHLFVNKMKKFGK